MQFHVRVEWPNERDKPWLVLIEAESEKQARSIVETSDDVLEGHGKVTSVERAP